MNTSLVTDTIKLESELILEQQDHMIETLRKEVAQKDKLLSNAHLPATISVANQAGVVRLRKKLPIRPPNQSNAAVLERLENGERLSHKDSLLLYGAQVVYNLPKSLIRVIVIDLSVYGQDELRILVYQAYSYEVINHLKITKTFEKKLYKCVALKSKHMHHEEFDYLTLLNVTPS